MPKFEVTQPHNLTAEEARKRIETLNAQLGDQYGLTSSWNSDTEATVKRTGASGLIRIEPTRVVVSLDLSWVLSAAKDKIEQKIKSELERIFTPA